MSDKIRLSQFSEEEHNLYYDILHAHTVEDVLSNYYCDEETASNVAERVRDNINKCERYFDAYWDCLDFAAEEADLNEK